MRYLTLFICLILGGCKEDESNKLRVGVTAGPHAIIMNNVKKLAKEQGLDIQIIEFNDFIQPNAALANKEIDVNCYQHEPFLDEQVKSRDYPIQSIAKTVLMPMGVYSKSCLILSHIREDSKVAIPNDPTNISRALLLLQSMNLIKLEDVAYPGIHHIKDNCKKINIVEIDAPQLPRVLDDVDVAIINTDWVILSGMNPKKALKTEEKTSPYINIIAAHKECVGDPRIKKLVELYQSPSNAKFIEDTFKGAVIAGW